MYAVNIYMYAVNKVQERVASEWGTILKGRTWHHQQTEKRKKKLLHSSFVPTTGYETSTDNSHQADQPLLETVHACVDGSGSTVDGPFQGVCVRVDRLFKGEERPLHGRREDRD